MHLAKRAGNLAGTPKIGLTGGMRLASIARLSPTTIGQPFSFDETQHVTAGRH